MKKSFLVLITICTLMSEGIAQIKAVTEVGDTIYVFDNGTWSFDGDMQELNDLSFLDSKISIDTVSAKQIKEVEASKMVTSRLEFFDIYYNQDKWTRMPPGQLNADAELAFKHKVYDLYAMVISEETEIGTENILKIAYNNFQSIDPDNSKLMSADYLNVNGVDMIRGSFKGNINGMKIRYDAHYYSNQNGTIQFTAFTGTSLYEKYKEDITELLNGLVITKQ